MDLNSIIYPHSLLMHICALIYTASVYKQLYVTCHVDLSHGMGDGMASAYAMEYSWYVYEAHVSIQCTANPLMAPIKINLQHLQCYSRSNDQHRRINILDGEKGQRNEYGYCFHSRPSRHIFCAFLSLDTMH
jgi:hypothetical protein